MVNGDIVRMTAGYSSYPVVNGAWTELWQLVVNENFHAGTHPKRLKIGDLLMI